MTRRACLCAGLLSSLLGCGSGTPDSGATCPEPLQQPLYNASATERYLGLAETQQRALVAIADDADPSALCSGAFIARTWVLTAAHCDELVKATVVVPAGTRFPSARLPVVRRELYPSADIALFQVDFSAASFDDELTVPNAGEADSLDALAFDILPLGVPSRESTRLAAGVAVELAGYGRTEQGDAGALRFLVEQVVAASASWITVAGFGRSGACEGDSGAPLLIRDEDGSPIVVGVLWGGSETCLHEDDYLRTDSSAIRSWIQNVLGTTSADLPSTGACGGISAEGRCLYGSALFCEGSSLVAQPCSDGRVCGWNSAESGYRCVPSGGPCSGFDAIGECRSGHSVRCVSGAAQATSCGACGVCRVDGETGVPYCAGDNG